MAKDFAIILTGGKQYKVSAGDKLKVENIEGAEEGGTVVFDAVLLRSSDGSVEVGAPHVAGAKAEAKVLRNAREKKKIIFKYHPKTRSRRKKGHRQEFTEIEITKI